jgi:transposase
MALSPGQAGDAPQGRALLRDGGPAPAGCPLLMDRAYQADETLELARKLGYQPVVPPSGRRLHPWEYDRKLYRQRNRIERLFRRIKGYRRVFSGFDKLDVMFAGFVLFALIMGALR